MNASLVVSISVLMIGAAIAIYAFLTGKTLADGEQFSLKFAADVSLDGTTMPAEVYFCTGPDCEYYKDLYSSYDGDFEAPEFFALVGINGGGYKYLTELSLGWIFEFDSEGVLTACNSLPDLGDYDPIAEIKDMANSATISSFDIGSVIDFSGEGSSMTITSHDIGYNPNVNEATVLGLKVPTPQECEGLIDMSYDAGSLVADTGTVVDATAETFPDMAEPVAIDGDGRRLTGEEGRKLWGSPTGASSKDMWWAAHGSYDNDEKLNRARSNGGWTHWVSCKTGNEHARFFYKCGGSGCNMVLAFAGSDDTEDWIYNNANLLPGGPGGKYHSGFYNYQDILGSCVGNYRSLLSRWGIKLDYIAGHSLGGAAASVYAQEHGNGLKGTVTFGAPKTNLFGSGKAVTGWRFIHRDDPVGSNLCFLGCPLLAHSHMLTNVYEVYDHLNVWTSTTSKRVSSKVKKCQKKWWKFWCWFETIWTVVYNVVTNSRWEKHIAGGKSQNFAYGFYNLLWGIYGALQKHGAYGDYPFINM